MTALEKLNKLISELPSMQFNSVKPPRLYAKEIMQLKTRDQRKEALANVPEELRQTVKFYVHDAWAKRTGNKLPDLKEKAHD